MQSAGIDKIIVSGFNAGACVMATVSDGLSEGFKVCVLSDAVENGKGGTKKDKLEHLKKMEERGALIQTSEQILNAIKPESEQDNIRPTSFMRKVFGSLGL